MSNALELAAIFDDELKWQTTPISRTEVAAELRRQYEQNAQLLEALKKIATVNAMDYEYQRWAKAAIAAVEGKI